MKMRERLGWACALVLSVGLTAGAEDIEAYRARFKADLDAMTALYDRAAAQYRLPNGKVDTANPGWKALNAKYQAACATLRATYVSQHPSKVSMDAVRQTPAGKSLSNTGSPYTSAFSDGDWTAKTDADAANVARQLQAKGHKVTYNPELGMWLDETADTKIWEPETEPRAKARSSNPEGYTRSGSLDHEGIKSENAQYDPEGYVEDLYKKYEAAKAKGDVRTMNKVVAKMQEATGRPFDQITQKMRVDANPYESGEQNLGESPEVAKAKAEARAKALESEIAKARETAKAQSESNARMREELAKKERALGNEKSAREYENANKKIENTTPKSEPGKPGQPAEPPGGKPGGPAEPGKPGGPTEPVKPGGTTEPVKPGGPAEPVKPGGPAEPIKPGGPAEPVKPGGPTEPVKPGGPTEPAKPGGPAEPVKPGGPAEPVKPAGPAEPVKPGGPAEPVKPGGPGEPVKPGGATEPVKPGGPTEPVKPSGPTEPVKPGGPTEPVKPGGPAKPVKPGGPAEPVKPGGPTEPVKPGGPAEPVKPGGPAEPVKPGGPAEPVKPGGPAEPVKPGGPTEPVKPGGPAEPVKPGGPTEPVKPGGPAEPVKPGGTTPEVPGATGEVPTGETWRNPITGRVLPVGTSGSKIVDGTAKVIGSKAGQAGLNVVGGYFVAKDAYETITGVNKAAAKGDLQGANTIGSRGVGRLTGGWIGGVAGAEVGVGIGTALGDGPGAVVGGFIGALGGGIIGALAGDKVGEVVGPPVIDALRNGGQKVLEKYYGSPELGRLPEGISEEDARFISVALDQSDWYCTNRPEIEAGVNLPDILSKAKANDPRRAAVDQARRTEAEIRAAAARDAAHMDARYQALMARLQKELNASYQTVKAAENGPRSDYLAKVEAYKAKNRAVQETASKMTAHYEQARAGLAARTGRQLTDVRRQVLEKVKTAPPAAPPAGR